VTDRIVYRPAMGGMLATSGDATVARPLDIDLYEGLVVDVILDHRHPAYAKDGYNIGAIKVRIFNVHTMIADKDLPWADPIDMSVLEMPLKGELVVLQKVRGNFFYSRKVPLARRVQENAMLNLNSLLDRRPAKSVSNLLSGATEFSPDKHKFGNYFKPDSRVRHLKHFEGDTVIQGRMGNTIRIGSAKMDPSKKSLAPNIIMRVGQAKDVETREASADEVFGLVMEDINRDATSLWLVSDQNLPFGPSARQTEGFYRSLKNPLNSFKGASITANSDTVILNAKKKHIMLLSNDEIYLNSVSRTSIDTDESIMLTAAVDIISQSSRNIEFGADEDFVAQAASDVLLTAVEKMSLVGKKIHIGSVQRDVEPMVGGTSLSIFLARLIMTLMGSGPQAPQLAYQWGGGPIPVIFPQPPVPGIATIQHVITPWGPGTLNPVIVAGLTQLYAELAVPNPGSLTPLPFSGAPFNSVDAFVALSHEDMAMVTEKNDFTQGTPTKVDENTWAISDGVYQVT
jgi:hypothetical protein